MIIHSRLVIRAVLIVLLATLILSAGLFIDAKKYGILPGTFNGFENFFLFSIIHTSSGHLKGNLMMFMPLFFIMAYFFDKVYFKVLILILITNSIGIFFIGRGDNVHVGASGLVYGISAFMVSASILKANKTAILIILLTIAISYSLFLDIIPKDFSSLKYSWESHFVGYISGAIFGFVIGNRQLSEYHKDLI